MNPGKYLCILAKCLEELSGNILTISIENGSSVSVNLNDLNDSGETEFLYQKKKVKPKAGRVLIFPGSFTHLHRGNPPYEAKYIATGWLASNDQTNILL